MGAISKKWLGSWVEEAAEEATETKQGEQQRTRNNGRFMDNVELGLDR